MQLIHLYWLLPGVCLWCGLAGELNAQVATTQIKVDQAGYLPDAPKLAMFVSQNSAEAPKTTFSLHRSDNQATVFSGSLSAPALDPDTNDGVQLADFSSFTLPGKFYLEVAGAGRSWTFSIAPDVYRRAYYLAMRSYYGQRCGTKVDLGAEFPAYRHEACHLTGGFDPSSGQMGTHVSAYGWHDAGDYGRYVVNSGISTGTLLWSWELNQQSAGKIALNLPESGNGSPDILNEVRWNLEWMLTMQDRDGGVWHKQTSTHFCAFIMPEQDKLQSVVIGTGAEPFKSSCATGDFAAVMAIAARDFRTFDAAFAGKCLHAATQAWIWLGKNPNVIFRNPSGVSTGDYGDSKCGDEALWAAAELGRTTGGSEYSQYFLLHYRNYLDSIRPAGPQSWGMVAPLALYTYVLGGGTDKAAVTAIREAALAAADAIVQRTSLHLYRISLLPRDFVWGSNAVAANYGMQLLIANRFQPNTKYRDAALDNLHYLLGRNTFSLSWVTQVGENSFRHPHHRPSAADGLSQPWPGLLAGGPNPGRQDATMQKRLDAGTPIGKMYVDETGAYACNEVAINWNAPLVFVLAGTLRQ